jgi:uncharacterized protein (TIGR00730 family)
MATKSYRNAEFLESEEARDIRILSDYTYPNSVFIKQKVKDTVVLFGSARIQSPEVGEEKLAELVRNKATIPEIVAQKKANKLSCFYQDARELARLITIWGREVSDDKEEKRLLVCTGGGPGIMEAGNRGAMDADGQSVALNIVLPHEQAANPYVTPELSIEFNYFFIRKLWFIHLAKAAVVFPGGFGTVDELFETLTLIQTHKIRDRIPVLLYGSDFWKSVINFELFSEYCLISREDLELFHYVDTPEQALAVLKEKIVL